MLHPSPTPPPLPPPPSSLLYFCRGQIGRRLCFHVALKLCACSSVPFIFSIFLEFIYLFHIWGFYVCVRRVFSNVFILKSVKLNSYNFKIRFMDNSNQNILSRKGTLPPVNIAKITNPPTISCYGSVGHLTKYTTVRSDSLGSAAASHTYYFNSDLNHHKWCFGLNTCMQNQHTLEIFTP